MVMILMNHKVRERVQETPAAPDPILEAPRRGPGRPKGSCTSSGAKVVREEVVGVKKEAFPHLPVELWNNLTAAIGDYLRKVASALDGAYSHGIEAQTVQLLDEVLPDNALALGRATMEALVAQERGFRGSRIHCHECSGELEYQGDVAKTGVKTRIGDIDLKRSYYLGGCGHSVCPLDRLLGLDGQHNVMPSLQDTVAWLSASMSYPEAVKVLDKLCPSKFSLKIVETITATIATQVQEAQQEEIKAVQDDPSKAARRNGDLIPGVAVVETDGGFILVRDHTEKSKEFKEAVLGTLEQIAPPPSDALPGEVDKTIKLVNKSYVGHFAGPHTLYEHVGVEFFRRGFHCFKTLHCLGDGGCWVIPWMKDLVQEGQELSLVLDWWHADERVSAAAVALYGSGTDEAAQWRATLRSALWESKLEDFFAELKRPITELEARQDKTVCAQLDHRNPHRGPQTILKKLQEHYDYFDSRRDLLRYKECRERGLPIGSGAIEGGVRFIGKDRLDRTGMRWNIAGAENILQLRNVKYSDRWDELAEKRAEKRRVRYESALSLWNKAA
jgi:hypothetical protein